MKTLNNVDKCPHCLSSHPVLVMAWSGLTFGSKSQNRALWGSFACNSCGGVVTAVAPTDNEDYLLQYPLQVFPSPPSAHEDIPEIARTFLQQAFDTLHAPDAATVMAASSVDAMLKSKGLSEGSLYKRIDEAVENGVLTSNMASWAHAVRLESNRPRHSDADRPHVTPAEARNAVDFAEALGNFLFVLDAKIQRGIAQSAES